MTPARPRRPVDLSPAALVRAGVGGALLYSPEAGGARSWTLAGRLDSMPGEPMAPEPSDEQPVGPVATVEIIGPLRQRAAWEPCEGYSDGYDAIEARFAEACQSGATDVRVVIDSPGGEAAGAFAAVRRMRALADKAGVRVWTAADECACSGGFVFLMLGDKGRVHCPAAGMTASIGVVWVLKTYADALKKEGIGAVVVRSGERKCRPSGLEPIDDADIEQTQALVDASAVEFIAWVAERRGLDPKALNALEGAVMTGAAARAVGLVDGNASAHEVLTMATAEAALAAMREALGLSADASVETMASTARAGVTASAEVIKLRGELAQIEAGKLALEEQTRRTAAEQARVAARDKFAGEVAALRTAGRLSPAAATALLGSPGDAAQGVAPTPSYYDRHGEAAARDMLATLKTDAPQVPAVGARPGAVPVPASGTGTLTAAQIEHAKAIGADPSAYAAAIQPATQEAP